MTEQEQNQIDAINRDVDRKIRISKAKINKNRTWYRLTSKAAGQAWDVMEKTLKTASDQQLKEIYAEICHLEDLNTWWFTVRMRHSIEAVVYHMLVGRGYRNDWDDTSNRPTRTWSKPPKREKLTEKRTAEK